MTYKDLYTVLRKIKNNESLSSTNDSANKEKLNERIHEAHILEELERRKFISNSNLRYTVGGYPILLKYPNITIDGNEFLKNYSGTFKNIFFAILKKFWLAIIFLFSLSGSYWALINILSYYGFINKP